MNSFWFRFLLYAEGIAKELTLSATVHLEDGVGEAKGRIIRRMSSAGIRTAVTVETCRIPLIIARRARSLLDDNGQKAMSFRLAIRATTRLGKTNRHWRY